MLQVHHVRVKGGPNGYADFVKDIQSIFGITTEHDMQLAFDCADPMTGVGPWIRIICADPATGEGPALHEAGR